MTELGFFPSGWICKSARGKEKGGGANTRSSKDTRRTQTRGVAEDWSADCRNGGEERKPCQAKILVIYVYALWWMFVLLSLVFQNKSILKLTDFSIFSHTSF